ncbi:Hypothetical protein NTJ_05006 [Nesidiocoris tenuis]|uniref:Uncharacterized protein n=2 Tax=Nesidiocoris tenuis TaxID=355587 RepID=A0ABN7AJR1_9HEMI|nr:Hypothetical protein NTJ_05006 [Nesidiocoris tenuis]
MRATAAISPSTIIIVIIAIKICTAHWDGAYMRNPTDGFSMKTRWLSEIRDDVKLREIAFPGTEKSGAFDASQRPSFSLVTSVADAIEQLVSMGLSAILNDAYTTQALNFKDQLNYGIRVLDIQLYHIEDQLILTCGYGHLNMGLDTVLDNVQLFLMNNPTETVLINLYMSKKIQPLDGFRNQFSVGHAIDSYLNAGRLRNYYLKPDSLDITLGEARGKFILISRETKFMSHVVKLNTDALTPSIVVNSIIMDQTYLYSNWDLHWQKWMPVKQHLLNTVASNDDKIFIDYLNGWGASFPYFVASGHSSPGTSAPRLATGLVTLNPEGSSPYPDFPRLSCLGHLCSVYFEGVNILARNLIRKINNGVHRRTVGILLIDFPGEDLINAIISNNDRLKR